MGDSEFGASTLLGFLSVLVVAVLVVWAVFGPIWERFGQSMNDLENCWCSGGDPLQVSLTKQAFTALADSSNKAKDPFLESRVEIEVCNCEGSKLSLESMELVFNITYGCSLGNYAEGNLVRSYKIPKEYAKVSLPRNKAVYFNYESLRTQYGTTEYVLNMDEAKDLRMEMSLPRTDETGVWRVEAFVDGRKMGADDGQISFSNSFKSDLCVLGG